MFLDIKKENANRPYSCCHLCCLVVFRRHFLHCEQRLLGLELTSNGEHIVARPNRNYSIIIYNLQVDMAFKKKIVRLLQGPRDREVLTTTEG